MFLIENIFVRERIISDFIRLSKHFPFGAFVFCCIKLFVFSWRNVRQAGEWGQKCEIEQASPFTRAEEASW
jgi:hypothetical protein